MQRILLFITDLEIGGTPTVVRELALRVRQPGACEVLVACLKGFGPVATELQRAGVTVKAFAAGSVIDLPSVIGELREFVREQRIDTVLSFLLHANTVAALAARGVIGVRWLQSIQTTQPSPRWHWWVQWIVQGMADRIIVPSKSVADAAADRANVPADKIVVIPNAVDAPSSTGGSPVGPEHGRAARATDRKIGFIGRLDPIKRVPDLIAAVAKLPAEITLDLWGEGAARGEIESAIAHFSLTSRVTLHGAIASPASALTQIDCLVLPSAAEGFGLVLIEAMAAGVPVVATNVAGIRDVVRDGQTGVLVPPGNPAALAAAIQRVLGDQPLRERLIASGLAEVSDRFTWDRVLPMYRELFAK